MIQLILLERDRELKLMKSKISVEKNRKLVDIKYSPPSAPRLMQDLMKDFKEKVTIVLK